MPKILVEANVDLALMVPDPNGDFYPSDGMTFQYYFAADPEFAAALQQRSDELMAAIYKDHYQIFREREPNDPNYIAVSSVAPRVVDKSEYPNRPWLSGKCPVWEESNLIGVTTAGYNKLSPQFFEAVLNSNL